MNNQNLKPFNIMSIEERKKIQSKGGYARAKKIAELKEYKAKFDVITEDKSLQDTLMSVLINKAKSGDFEAIKTLIDIGLKFKEQEDKEEHRKLNLLLKSVKAGLI